MKRSKEVKANEETVFKSVFIHFRHIIDHPNKHLFYEDLKKFNLPSTESQELRKFLTLSRTFSTFHWRYWIKIHLGPKIHSDRNYMGKYRYNTYHTWIYVYYLQFFFWQTRNKYATRIRNKVNEPISEFMFSAITSKLWHL